ncbi:hypothetical protein Tco_1336241 [Tanacetum coccineum]
MVTTMMKTVTNEKSNGCIKDATSLLISKMDNLIKRIEQHNRDFWLTYTSCDQSQYQYFSGYDVRSSSSSSSIVNDLGSSMINNKDMEVVSGRKYGENVVKCGKQDDAHEVFDKDRDEGYLIDLFIWGLHPEIREYSSEVMNEDFGLVSIDKVSEKDVKIKEIEPNDSRKVCDNESLVLFDEFVHENKESDNLELLGNCSCGFKMDEVDGKKFVGNGFKLIKIDETQVAVHGLEDSKMDFDRVCGEAGKNRELELNESSKVDVNGVANCEEDEKNHETESNGVIDDNIDMKNLVEVSKERDKDEEMSSKDSSKVCGNEDNGLEENFSSYLGVKMYCVSSSLVEVTTIVEKTNTSVESVKEGTNLICSGMSKEVIGLVDCGCDKSGMMANESANSQLLAVFKKARLRQMHYPIASDTLMHCVYGLRETDKSPQDCVTGGEMNLVSEFQDCVKGGENELEMVVDKLVEKNDESFRFDKKLDASLGSHIAAELTEFSPTGIGVNGHENGFEDQLWRYEKHKESLVNGKEYDGKQDGNKEDGEFVNVSEEIELSDHCSMDIRGAGFGCGNDEREQTLNELLTELNDFSGNSGVVVLTDINGPNNVFGSSMLRPGKFGMHQSIDKIDVARLEFSLKEMFLGSLEVLVGSFLPVLKEEFRNMRFHRWKWRRRKKIRGAKCEFKYKSGNLTVGDGH